MGTHINDLPTEVLEAVFNNLKCQSLFKAKGVCKRWYTIIKGLQSRRNFWKRQCCKELSKNVLEELSGQRSLKIVLNDDSFMWKSMYKSWIRGQMISFWPWSKRCIPGFSNNGSVTCIKLSGYWIVTSHLNGCLYSWNQTTGREFALVSHGKRINDFAFIDILGKGPYGSIDKYTWNHHHIISVGKDHVINITPVLKYGPHRHGISLRPHGDSLEKIRVFNNHFVVSCADNTFSVWKMSRKAKEWPSVERLAHVLGPFEILHWIGFWNQEVHCLSRSMKLCTYRPVDDRWQNFEVTSTVTLHPYATDCRIRNAFLFRNNVIVLIEDEGDMSISIDKVHFSKYFIMKALRTTIISVALRGCIFALGTENGKLFLYSVTCDEDLMILNLECPSWSKTLSEASIISIDISENEECTVIAACDNIEKFVFCWYSPGFVMNTSFA